MPITHLSTASSLNPGADLWIIPDLQHSRSALRLDWYMNLQLTKSTLHSVPQLSPELQSILAKCDLPETRFYKKTTEFVMFESSRLLPNRWVVQIQTPKSHDGWVENASLAWTGLQKPSLRVFLPSGLSAGEFQKHWKELNSFDDFSLVVD
jgi:hypothetical protein